jgi:uncharacterized membrane protein
MIQVLSVIGAILILAAYAGVQTRRMDAGSLSFSAINAAGAGLLSFVALVEDQVGFFILEGVWSLVSLAGMARALVTQRT